MKRKLLFAIVALMCSVGTWAQKDVTSQYITNATLSSLDGWTNTNFNAPVQGNNTIGYASECYAGWGSLEKTNYSLTQKITLPAGHYTLVNYSFFRYGLAADTDASKSLAYLKAGDNQVAIKTLGSITAAGYANSQAEGANCFDSKMYRNTLDFTIDADNTEIEIGVFGTFDLKQSWMILGMFELIDNNQLATMDSPFDVTGYITNPGFEYRDMTGWTVSPSGYFGTQSNSQGFKVGGYYAEKWQSSEIGALAEGSMSQTLTDLPAGLYRFTANLGGNGTYIDLNGKTVNWTVDGNYTASYVLAENEDLVIKAGKTAEGTANWIHLDNFKLLYCGDVAAALTASVAKKTTYNGLIPTAAYNKLVEDVDAYDKTYSDVDELLTAIDAVEDLYAAADLLKDPYATWKTTKTAAEDTKYAAISGIASAQESAAEAATTVAAVNDAISALNTAMTNYDAWLTMKAYADALVAAANDNPEANSTLASAISTQAAAVTSPTDAAAIATATSTLKDAMVTYAGAANPVGDGVKFDLTFMLTNPDLTNFAAWTKNIEGWYTDQNTSGQNSQAMHSEGVKGSHGDAFYEYWSETAAANNQFTLYQKVTLPEGTYTISCDALATANGVEGATTSAVYFFANDTQGSLINSEILTAASISFVNATEQEVKIGLKAMSGNQFRWMGIGYVELYKVPAAAAVVLDESVAYVEADAAADVKLTKTIYEGWNTVILPFSMTAPEVEEVFGEGTLYSFTGADEGTLNFETASALAPHTPYLFKATAAKNIAGETITGRTITVSSNGLKTAGTDYNFVGVYAPYAQGESPIVVGADYVLGADNNFHLTTVKNAMKAFRAYIQANEATEENPVKALLINIDGVETAIQSINGENVNNGAIYNLAGQRVNNAQKGIYIVNGKKVLVK